ncbi:MAG TPA: type II toxin-antitoxin system VapC family toxin [Gemmatimonadota bacterium]|nr:type II toxin-antitoxin system VapC family toxin [Gemmatimonadota bacterium]
MRFWASSGIVPLLVEEDPSRAALELLGSDPSIVVWWATPTECVSALARREREGELTALEFTESLKRLDALTAAWQEVAPVEPVRATARRMLRVHPLRAADALQLAAAAIVAEGAPTTLEVVTLDERLAAAAHKEGFRLPL